jgi:hypothetical protein
MSENIKGEGHVTGAQWDKVGDKTVVKAMVRCDSGAMAGKGGTVTLWLDTTVASNRSTSSLDDTVKAMRAAGYHRFGEPGINRNDHFSRVKSLPVTITFVPSKTDGRLWPKYLAPIAALPPAAEVSDDEVNALFGAAPKGEDGDIPF